MTNSLILGTLFLLLVVSILCLIVLRKYRKHLSFCNFHRMIFDAIPVCMFLLDKGKHFIEIYNMSEIMMCGYTKSDIIGKHLSVFANDEKSPFYHASLLLDKAFDKVVLTNKPDSNRCKVGDAYFESSVHLLRNGCVLSVVSDISRSTEIVNLMMQKKQNEIAVALYAGGLTSWSFDVKNRLFDSTIDNDVIDKAMTYDNLLSKMYSDDDRTLVNDTFDKLIKGEIARGDFTVRVTNKIGVVQWANVHALPDEYDQGGNVKTIVGSQKDITQEVEAIDELRRLRDKAEESNMLKSAFLANMSHEIRTPLNAIVGFSNLISTAETKEELNEYIKIIEQNNSLLLNIINDVLDLSKIESNKLNLVFTEINASYLLQSLGEITNLKVQKGVKIILDDVDVDLKIYSDINRLSQVLTNFLNNASKFTSEGSISMGCKRVGDQLYFYVKDTGTGIAQEDLSVIFDRFVKLDSFVQGTGLGLPICETIISRMGGTIGVESEIGKGSTFWFKIPVIDNDDISVS